MAGETMIEKWKACAPYHIFYNVLPDAHPDSTAQPNEIEFSDLLCPSLGQMDCSLHFSSVVDFNWLIQQYEKKNVGSLPLTVIAKTMYVEVGDIAEKFKQITYYQMNVEKYTHHSRTAIFAYDDGSLRVVISTANLYKNDWSHFNQQLWISPSCPIVEEGAENGGESPTGFRYDLLTYLKSYNSPHLDPWIKRVRKTDFSAIRVFLITSIPGVHDRNSNKCHRYAMSNLLQRHCNLPPEETRHGHKQWKVIAQASNIGNLGRNFQGWVEPLLGCLTNCQGFSTTKFADFSFVYPTKLNSVGYLEPGQSYNTYTESIERKQMWFRDYLHQWKADRLNRSRAMPHVKYYTRISPCLTKLAYYLLTSANFTKTSWGNAGPMFGSGNIGVHGYEVGVLFLPKFFGEKYFEIQETGTNENRSLFPFICDLPLCPYESEDVPLYNE